MLPFAEPMLSAEHVPLLAKLLKKSPQHRRGIKAVTKTVVGGEKGMVAVARDVTPHDLITHLPMLCEEKDVPLFFIQSKFDILTDKNKATTCIFIPETERNAKRYKKVMDAIEK